MTIEDPICLKCRQRYVPKKLGASFTTEEDGRVTYIGNLIQRGDIYECPACEHQIVTKMGKPYSKNKSKGGE